MAGKAFMARKTTRHMSCYSLLRQSLTGTPVKVIAPDVWWMTMTLVGLAFGVRPAGAAGERRP